MKQLIFFLGITLMLSCDNHSNQLREVSVNNLEEQVTSKIDKNDIYIACDSNTYVLDQESKRFYRFRKDKKAIRYPIFVQDRANNKSKDISEQEFNLISFASPNEIYDSFIHKKIDSTKKIYVVEENDSSYYLHEVEFLRPLLPPPPPVWKRIDQKSNSK